MKKNHRKDQNMWSSHITTNNSCRCQQFIFLTPDWLFSCNTITYSCRYNKGCFGHWVLGRYCLEVTQANHYIVLYAQNPIICKFLQCPKQPLLNQLYFQKYFWCSQVWQNRRHFAMPTLVFLQTVMKRHCLDLCGASNWSAVSEIYFNQSKAHHIFSLQTSQNSSVLLQSSASVCQQVQHPVFIQSLLQIHSIKSNTVHWWVPSSEGWPNAYHVLFLFGSVGY